MATYNGESFLREQLDSILYQEDVDVTIMIADDCSTDNTYSILTAYANQYENIQILQNLNNLGYKKNFLMLIQRGIERVYDYFALADQDDVWDRRKLISAIAYIESHYKSDNDPIAYSSNLQLVDKELRLLSMMTSQKEIKKFNEYNLLLENKCTGCTLVFNNALRQELLSFPVEKIVYPHDELICKLAILTGLYFYDGRSFIQYRQHGNNQIGADKKGHLKKYMQMLSGKKESTHSRCFRDIAECYEKEILPKFRPFVQALSIYKTKVSVRIKILFSRKFRKSSFRKTMIFKAAILLKKY